MQLITKIISNSKFKRFILVSALLILYVCISAVSYTHAVTTDIADSVFRLHVIANSDTIEDQNLKFKVRDALIKYMNEISKECTSKDEVINLAKDHSDDFYSIAKQVIEDNGYNYDVKINIGNFDFPTKKYGDISFPAGNYDALRVEIGNASGQNWWCVMFPPLCFVDVTSGVVPDDSKSMIRDNLSDEEYSIISDSASPDIQFKFSLIEMFQNFKVANK